jgi:hypothetical protein
VPNLDLATESNLGGILGKTAQEQFPWVLVPTLLVEWAVLGRKAVSGILNGLTTQLKPPSPRQVACSMRDERLLLTDGQHYQVLDYNIIIIPT